MDTTWRRVLAVGLMVIALLFLANLEIANSRILRDHHGAKGAGDQVMTPRWQQFLITQGELLSLEAGPIIADR